MSIVNAKIVHQRLPLGPNEPTGSQKIKNFYDVAISKYVFLLGEKERKIKDDCLSSEKF